MAAGPIRRKYVSAHSECLSLLFCVYDAKINWDLENRTAAGEEAPPLCVCNRGALCFALGLRLSRRNERESKGRQSNKKYIVFILFSLTDETTLDVILQLLLLLWGELNDYLGGK